MNLLPTPWLRPTSFVVLALALSAGDSLAGTALLQNRSKFPVAFLIRGEDGKSNRYSLAPDEILPVPADQPRDFLFETPNGKVQRRLAAGRVYHFLNSSGGPIFRDAAAKPPAGPVSELTIKALVDEEEAASEPKWRDRLKARIQSASDVLEARCGLRLTIVEMGTWNSTDGVTELAELLAEFRREVPARPARLAVGFTSQIAARTPRIHLGVTLRPLGDHILVREKPAISEIEKSEVLIHELGHFLGAPHSPDGASVMRPGLGDGKARSAKFQVDFDPVTATIIQTVSRELKNKDLGGLGDLSPGTQRTLRELYTAVARQFPEDQTASHYLSVLEAVQTAKKDDESAGRNLFHESARGVVANVVATAERNASAAKRLDKDSLTEAYFRQAAAYAGKLPDVHGKRALLVGLAVAFDRSNQLRSNLLTQGVWRSVEPDAARVRRLAVLGDPTMHNRADLAQHFFVSAGLTALFGARMAETIGVQKEILDSRGGSGFSFADLSANLAGIAFAQKLLHSPDWPKAMETKFTVQRIFPLPPGLAEGMQRPVFEARYGSTTDPRFRKELERIRRLLAAAPGLQELTTN